MVATANVLRDLRAPDAAVCLDDVIAAAPDLVALQEWGPQRLRLLHDAVGYRWSRPRLGGCVIGVRTDRFEVVGLRGQVLVLPGLADRPDRWAGLEPARVAVVATLHDRVSLGPVTFVGYHLSPGVQAHSVTGGRSSWGCLDGRLPGTSTRRWREPAEGFAAGR